MCEAFRITPDEGVESFPKLENKDLAMLGLVTALRGRVQGEGGA